METENEPQRKLFHTTGGGIDFSRMVEAAAPNLIVGIIVIFATTKVLESQIGDLKDARAIDRAAVISMQQQLTDLAIKQAGISAQTTLFLGQQVSINSTLDSRLTFMERSGGGFGSKR